MINCLLLILIFHPFSCRNVTIPSESVLFQLYGYKVIPADGNFKDEECFDVAMKIGKVGLDDFSVELLRTVVDKNGSYYICEFSFDLFDKEYMMIHGESNIVLIVFYK